MIVIIVIKYKLMGLKNYILFGFVLLLSISAKTQSHLQKKADNLFNNYSFVDGAAAYQELIVNNDNTIYAIRQLGDSYALMRNPESAVKYYKKAMDSNHSYSPIQMHQ